MPHTKFLWKLVSTGSREEDFWRVFTIYGRSSHFGHVTSIMSNFHFLEPEILHIKFGFDCPVVSEEKPVLSFICNWLWVKVKKWPRPSILTYLHNFMQFQVTGCKSSEKSTVFTFSYRKNLSYQIWPCRKIGQGQPTVNHLNKLWWAGSHRCYIPSFMEIDPPVPEKKIFEGFLNIYGHGSHLGHVTSIMSINFHFLVPESLHIKFGFDWPSGFWEKQVLSFVCKWPWAKVKKWPWPSILTYVHFFSWFQVTGCNCSEKSSFHFFL